MRCNLLCTRLEQVVENELLSLLFRKVEPFTRMTACAFFYFRLAFEALYLMLFVRRAFDTSGNVLVVPRGEHNHSINRKCGWVKIFLV